MTSTLAETTYELSRWDLSELAEPGEEGVARRFAEIEEGVARFEARRAELDPRMSPGAFLDVLCEYEGLIERLNLLSSYASLRFAEDTGSREALSLRNRVHQALTRSYNRVLFFGLWWRTLADEEAEALLPAGPENADYRHYLSDSRRLRPYTLDERSEQIINTKDENGMSAVLTIYSMLTNGMEFTLEVDGETRKLTRDGLQSYTLSPRAEMRAAAYDELYRVYGESATVLGQIYSHRVRDWSNEHVGMRGYRSPIAVRNVDNDVPDEAVDVLLQVARENAPLFQRYFRLKAGWLGMERLRRSDIYAPLAASDREIPFAEAVRSVLRPSTSSIPSSPSTRSGCSATATSTASCARASAPAPSARPCCRGSPPGCSSTTPARCATSPPWRTSSGTPSTA